MIKDSITRGLYLSAGLIFSFSQAQATPDFSRTLPMIPFWKKLIRKPFLKGAKETGGNGNEKGRSFEEGNK